jgi:hypothetical protein
MVRQRDHHRLKPSKASTCDDWLQVVRPRLAEPLFEACSLARLHALACRLPGDATVALELRLAEDRPAADLSLRLTRPDQACALADRFVAPHLRDLMLGWEMEAGDDSPVSALWLEFDLEPEDSPGLSPIACAGLRHRVEPGWVARSLLPRLHGQPLADRQRALVESCCAAIPAGARLLYVFSLLPRGAGEVRLEILGFDPPGLLRYLRRTVPGAAEWVAEHLPVFADADRLHVSLDIGERISSRVGVEGSFRRPPVREPGWRDLFDRLVARGLCSPEKRDAALAWPGHDSFWTAPAAWPAAADRLALSCVRSLSHVKLVFAADREVEAKVYLLLTPLRRRPSRGRHSESR